MACSSCGGGTFTPNKWKVTTDDGAETIHLSRTHALVDAARRGGIVEKVESERRTE